DRDGAELPAVASLDALVIFEAVQKRGVRRIDADLERLQPVAFHESLEGEAVAVGRDKAVEIRQGRRCAGAEIGKDQPVDVAPRIAGLADAPVKQAAFGLGRGFEAGSGRVEQPAVERTAQPAVLSPGEGEIGATMRAGTVKQAQTSRFIAKQYKILA